MSIGLGVFLGLFFCGLIYLYAQTKDRWNWSKGCKGIFLLGLISIGGVVLYYYYQGLPKVVSEFKGIKLGDSVSDVTFKLGKPTELKRETYEYHSLKVFVKFREKSVERILYICNTKQSDYTHLNGISCFDGGEEILNKFGKEVRVLCKIEKNTDNYLFRRYDVIKYGTWYLVNQNSVGAMGIEKPETLKSHFGETWDNC